MGTKQKSAAPVLVINILVLNLIRYNLSMSKIFNILIISPLDVKYERDIAEKVCKELNPYLKKHNITLKSYRYENFPSSFNHTAQDNFENYFKIEDANLAVAIFWKRIGTLLPNKKGAISKTEVTGSQYEIEEAIYHKKPLWIYVKKDKRYDEDVEDEIYEEKEQIEKLNNFLNNLKIGFGNPTGYHYFYKKDFESMFKKHLIAELNRLYGIKLDINEIQTPKDGEINPSYYFGLYGFLVMCGAILFFYNINYIQSPKIKLIIYLFVMSLFFVNIPAIKYTPIYTVRSSIGFKAIFFALLRRAGFMIFYTILLAIFLYLVTQSLGLHF